MVGVSAVSTAGDESLLRAAAENHREWFRRNAAAVGGEVVDVGGAELFVAREAMIFAGPELDVDALMSEIRAQGCGSVGCWSLSADPKLGTRLVARGFGWGWRPHWMAIDLDHGSDWVPPTSFRIQPAAPPYAKTLPYAPTGPEPPGSFRLGVRLREKTIGQIVVNPFNGVAGIYSMGVAPRVRRRGIGLALTQAACRLGAEHGCRQAVLNATDAGEPVYRRAGFRSLGWGQTWWYCPQPEPTPRRVALTEAIGFGDVAALDALAPTTVELTDPLPGGESPLELALVTDQPEVAGYLLDRCPGLAAVRFQPHGATLLHIAAEHHRPAFVNVALAHGVDPTVRDHSFNATAAGWANHFGHGDIADQLAAQSD